VSFYSAFGIAFYTTYDSAVIGSIDAAEHTAKRASKYAAKHAAEHTSERTTEHAADGFSIQPSVYELDVAALWSTVVAT
jgi:hypothetical protein